jgi:hypothetical protein
VPAEASILEKGSTIRAPGFVSVALTANEDGSIGAIISGSVAQHTFSSDRMEFEVKPGDVCTISISGKEAYELFKPSVFMTEPTFGYPVSKRSRL